MQRKSRKDNKIRTMDRILVILALFLFVFIVCMIYLHITTGSTPDVLITCVFAGCSLECGIMGWIKTAKEKYQEEKEKQTTITTSRRNKNEC